MIKYQDENIIVHEMTNPKEMVKIDGVTLKPNQGDLEKYSKESIEAISKESVIWYNGYATIFDPKIHYIIEYLTGVYIGVGVDLKENVNINYIANILKTEVTTNEATND